MATITLNYNARNNIAAKTIEYILSLGVFKVDNPKTTHTFDNSIRELQSGEVSRLKNVENPIAEILQ
ncbi:MAG: hypothetical protein LBE36_06160 [Flavobacteriaceae bacterium]|jgi:hypothetical protein|nr:hypothetical protein [Flavobacteriaceae bacterium]